MENELIQVTQLPIIIEHLHSLKEEIEKRTDAAMNLVCVAETIQTVKSERTELNKLFLELEDKRKSAKSAVMAPYMEFEAVYKECVTEPFHKADEDLKQKISTVEAGIISTCREEMQEYFAELTAAEHLEWLTFDRLNLKIGVTEAKKKSHKALREQIAFFVCVISETVRSISEMDNPEELMVEYQKTLNLPNAIGVVADRHRRVEEQRKAREAWEEKQKAEREAVRRVESVLPPPVTITAPTTVSAPVEPPTAQEKQYKCTFTVHASKTQLMKLKEFLNMEGIRYE